MNPILSSGTQLLVMCSTKMRSGRIREMIRSFNATKRGPTEIVIYASTDDPDLPKYKEVLANEKFIVGPPRNMVQVLNYLSTEAYPGLSYYAEVNDDHVYVTEGWDVKMMAALKEKNDWGICYGATKNLPTATIISGKVVRTMGYYMPPVFSHGYVDNFIVEFGKATGLLIHLPDVLIEHRHHSYNMAKMDKTYEWVNNNIEDSTKVFRDWAAASLVSEVKKLIIAREADTCTK